MPDSGRSTVWMMPAAKMSIGPGRNGSTEPMMPTRSKQIVSVHTLHISHGIVVKKCVTAFQEWVSHSVIAPHGFGFHRLAHAARPVQASTRPAEIDEAHALVL